MYKEIVNALGQQCPVPVVMATRALREMREPGVLEVHVDNEAAVQNLTRMAGGHQFTAESRKTGEKEYVVSIQVTRVEDGAKSAEPVQTDTAPAAVPTSNGDYVVAITDEIMGGGDAALGATLMKGFVFALTQLETLPSAIILYNGGAKLTAAESPVLEDLKSLEASGVDIWTCGTCVNFYGLPAPAVGQVTNMYSIAELLTKAGKVVRP